jgi:hypothetical protein
VVDPVNVLWAAIGAAVAVFLAARAWSHYQGPKDSSLGSVSEQWLAEQRLNRPDSHR